VVRDLTHVSDFSTFLGLRAFHPYLQGSTTDSIMLPNNAQIIPKERIPTLRFPRQPLMLSDTERRAILHNMEEATRLGNSEHGKCRIVFQDDEGLKAVETTIWTYDPDNIVLKYGMVIPVSRVVSVDIP
jgi:hypothetical protein